MKYLVLTILLFSTAAQAQELFTFTEPASNMAAKSIGIRLNSSFGSDIKKATRYLLNPEVMVGISRTIMVHANTYFSNNPKSSSSSESFTYNGAGLYLKYRFFSQDEVHSHFRIAAFVEVASSNVLIEQPAISLNGNSTGYEAGLVATKLINKVAMSASAAYIRAYNNQDNKFPYGRDSRSAFDYTLSLGKLMLPKEYTSYNQTNINLMVELLGQYNPALNVGYIDMAPSVQMILQSRMRVDAGYRFPLSDNLFRTNPRGFLIRFEYNIFNAYR